MGIDFHNKVNYKSQDLTKNKLIRSHAELPLTRSDLLFLKSIGLKIKKKQWRRWKN
jgi:hypothetical protein